MQRDEAFNERTLRQSGLRETATRFLNAFFLAFVLSACAGSGDDESIVGAAGGGVSQSFDANGDGRTDLILESSDSTNPWGFGVSRDGRIDTDFLLSQAFDRSVYLHGKAIAAADADADGKDDLLVRLATFDGFIEWKVFLSDGLASTRTIDVALLPDGDDARVLAFTDIDGDGKADILLQQQVGGFLSFYVSYSLGDTFSERELIYSFDIAFGRPEIIALDDVNDDGTADLVLDLQYGSSHSYAVCLYENGFGPQPSDVDGWRTIDELSQLDPSPEGIGEGGTETVRRIDAVGVADITGDGQLELVFSVNTRVSETFRVSRTPGAVQFLSEESSETSWLYLQLRESPGGSSWGPTAHYLDTNSNFELERDTVALLDLDGDGRSDLLTKSSTYDSETSETTVTWVGHLLRDNGGVERRTWFEDSAISSSAPLFGTEIGVGDFNGDGREDLLLDAAGGSGFFSRLYVLLNNGTTFDPRAWEPWYTNDSQPMRIVGLERGGLTTGAKDTSALIAWAGMSNTPLYTRTEFASLLASKGFDLKSEDEIGAVDTLLPGECQLIYDTVDNDDLSANFGTLACLDTDIGGGVTLKQQVVYGGCDLANKGAPNGIGGAQCELGFFKQEYSVDILGVEQKLILEGPKVSGCAAVSAEFTCARVGATFASVSRSMMVGDTGVGAGVSVGVGAGATFGVEDGVISGAIDLKLGIGVTIEFSLDAQGAVSFVARHGATGYIFLRDNAGDVVVSAGEAIIDAVNAVNDTGGAVVEGIGEGVEYAAGEVAAIGEEVVDLIDDGLDAIVDFFSSLF